MKFKNCLPPTRKNKQIAIFYSVFGMLGVIVLPLLWFLFCSQADFLKDSTSDVGGKFGHYAQLVSLSVVYSAYLFIGGLHALSAWGYKDKIAKIIYSIGVILFLVTCVLPFDQNCQGTLIGWDGEKARIIGEVHDVLARVTVGFLLLSLIYFQIMLLFKSRILAISSLTATACVVGFSVFMIAKHGTCSIAECVMQSYLTAYIFFAALTAKINGLLAEVKEI